jgi:hypothetical protein
MGGCADLSVMWLPTSAVPATWHDPNTKKGAIRALPSTDVR